MNKACSLGRWTNCAGTWEQCFLAPSSSCCSFLAGLGTTGYQSSEVLVPTALREMNPWALQPSPIIPACSIGIMSILCECHYVKNVEKSQTWFVEHLLGHTQQFPIKNIIYCHVVVGSRLSSGTAKVKNHHGLEPQPDAGGRVLDEGFWV